MNRKVFLSFLGTSDYKKTKYCLVSPNDCKETAFIQNAILHFLKKANNEKLPLNKAYIFVTQKAKQRNWDELINELNKYELDIEPVDINAPKNKNEIWHLFEIIYERLNENDELYIDITHSFRYMPMVMLALLNYALAIKNIKVKGIYYGAYEAIDENGAAPILELESLFSILQWSNAATNLEFGEVKLFTDLTKEEINPILASTRGQDKIASNIREVVEFVQKLFQDIKSVRLKNIYSLKLINQIQKKLNFIIENKEEIFPPFVDIIKTMKPILEDFKENCILNGFTATKICIQNEWIQQGYTILQETLLSYAMKLNEYKFEQIFNRNERSKFVEEMHMNNDLKINNEFLKLYRDLSGLRNDINHAGMRQEATTSDKLKTKLQKFYNDTLKIITHAH